jgi:hypothetical protein
LWWCPDANCVVEKILKAVKSEDKYHQNSKVETLFCENWGSEGRCSVINRTCKTGGINILENFDD